MKKALVFTYGLVSWAGFVGLFLYFIGFLGDFLVPKTINSGPVIPTGQAAAVNLFLIALFGIHHSVAARPWFKEMVRSHCPEHMERSTYVLISNVLFFLIMWQWKPMPAVLWEVESGLGRAVIYAVYGSGYGLVLLSSFLINHFDLFGVRQVFLYLQGKAYSQVPFKISFLYKLIRHPLMLGWFIAFWSTPKMTAGHFLFAAGMTAYGLIGIYFEERTLTAQFGDSYKNYKADTPMIVPVLKTKSR